MRLFVAVDLDEAARDVVAFAIVRLREAGLDARFQPREKWHVTVAFLGVAPRGLVVLGRSSGRDHGRSPDDQLHDVTAALRRACAACAPFDLTLDKVGAFPDDARPRVIWVGSASPQPDYAACATRVRAAMTALGYAFDDDAIPHVTVCRLKHGRSRLPAISLPHAAAVHVGAMNLYESLPDKGTTRHVLRERIPLGERALQASSGPVVRRTKLGRNRDLP